MANGGTVTAAAAEAFARALALDGADPRARFYRGLALLQEGDRQGAFDAWAALVASSPGDAPWLPELQRRVAALGGELGLDPADLPEPAPGPSAAQAQAAEVVMTQGATQSNHARQTAAAAARLGMACHILLEDRTGSRDPNYRTNGNVLLDHLHGATTEGRPSGLDMNTELEAAAS